MSRTHCNACGNPWNTHGTACPPANVTGTVTPFTLAPAPAKASDRYACKECGGVGLHFRDCPDFLALQPDAPPPASTGRMPDAVDELKRQLLLRTSECVKYCAEIEKLRERADIDAREIARLRQAWANLRLDRARLRAALERFLKPRYSLGASHPHLSAYVAYDDEVWEQGKAAALASVQKEGA